MRKKVHITVITGMLSLLGIIYIELSWIKSNIKLQKASTHSHIQSVLQEVNTEITEFINERSRFLADYGGSSKKNPLLNLNNRINSHIVSAGFYFNSDNILKKIKDKFNALNLGFLKFEYGIVRNDIVLLSSMKSKVDFLNLIKAGNNLSQTLFVSTLRYHQQLSSDSASYPLEILYLCIDENNILNITSSLIIILLAIFLFTLVVIYIFYKTFSYILRQEKIDLMKTNFINNMTHEFKTPIAAIKLASEILKPRIAKTGTPALIEYMDIIQQENNRMLQLVETILNNANISRGEIRLDRVYLNINDHIKNLLEPYKMRITEQGGLLSTNLTADHPILLADPTYINSAIGNIIDNAIKYARSNRQLKVHIYTKNKDQNTISIYIQDNGIGISKQDAKKVFDKFYRVPTKNLHNIKGFGLGLNYARAIIEAHKGSISIKSSLGTGTTIKIILPVQQ